MPDYIVSLVPLTVENRETAASADEAAKQAAVNKFAATMSEGTTSITVHVMRIIEEPVSVPVTVNATMSRTATTSGSPPR